MSISDFINISNSTFRTQTNGTIDYRKILEVIDTSGVANYTFRVENHPEDNYKIFHNLVLSQNEIGAQEVFIMKHENRIESHKIEQFEGKITARNISEASKHCDAAVYDGNFNDTNPVFGP